MVLIKLPVSAALKNNKEVLTRRSGKKICEERCLGNLILLL